MPVTSIMPGQMAIAPQLRNLDNYGCKPVQPELKAPATSSKDGFAPSEGLVLARQLQAPTVEQPPIDTKGLRALWGHTKERVSLAGIIP